MFISGILIMFNLYTAIPITEHLANDFGISQSVAAMNGAVFQSLIPLAVYFMVLFQKNLEEYASFYFH